MTDQEREALEPGGDRWEPRDKDTKAIAFYVDTGGETVGGTYVYADGRRRRGSMSRITLHRDWDRAYIEWSAGR